MRATRQGLRAAGLAVLCLLTAPAALASSATRTVRYHGYAIRVPRSWPVYDLGRDPSACVRFNRHALYLGQPGSAERCPAHALGHTEAILVAPLGARVASASVAAARQLLLRRRGIAVTATWGRDPEVIERALGIRSLSQLAPAARSAAIRALPAPVASIASVFTGRGFDACSAPSAAHMSAWSSSPYRAVGVYIGGTNMACSQPNLTAAWVAGETAAGWHLIPTYVGLQAPSNSCGCSGIDPTQAHAQGTAAATDAVAEARSLGIGAHNPIYFDMEAYSRGATNTPAVLAFLSGWTTQLHADGYVSGIYSSAASGIVDLVAQYGSSYPEPDDIWIADWNGQLTTSDSYVPSGAWPNHQRLHQYVGSHNETYGGVTINIDGDYLDGATAGANAAPVIAPAPAVSVKPGPDGVIHLSAQWYGASGISAWRVLGGAGAGALTAVAHAAKHGNQTAIAVHSSYPWFAVQALDSAGNVLGASAAVATPPYIAIYGRSAFVSKNGLGGVPAGCFTGRPCHIAATVSAGKTTIATTGRELIPAGGGGVLHFSLSRSGRALLAHAPGHRLSVRVSGRDGSGRSATVTMTAVRFTSSGHGPHRSLHQTRKLRIIGVTHFVAGRSVGGILTACLTTSPCHPSTTIVAHGVTIARTSREFLGANELGYLIFTLTGSGRAMLARAPGNQLGAQVVLRDGPTTASGDIALVRTG